MKNLLLNSIVLIQILFYTNSNAQWTQISKPDTNKITTIAADNSCIYAGTNNLGIYKSTDGGLNWTLKYNVWYGQTISTNNKSITSLNINGSTVIGTAELGGFYSLDNGSNWHGHEFGTWLRCNSSAISTNSSDSKTLFIATDYKINSKSQYEGGLYSSIDNGTTWIQLKSGSVKYLSADVKRIVSGYNSNTYLTTDNGTNWKTIDSTSRLYPFVVVGPTIISNKVIILNDGASSISNGLGVDTRYINSFSVSQNVTNDSTVVSGTTYGIYYSTNLGHSWITINTGLTNLDIYEIAITDKYIFAVSSDGNLWRRSLSEISTGEKDNISMFDKDISLTQVFPNPSNSSITISFKLPVKSFVSLKIYNYYGQVVKTLIFEELVAGNYEKQYNVLGLTNGFYFCKLQHGAYVDTKKFILEK
jgi:hypothetical protein